MLRKPAQTRASTTLPRAPAVVAALLGAGTLLGPEALAGQFVEDPLLPRGAFLVEAAGTWTDADRMFGPGDERVPFGRTFFEILPTPEAFPALEAEQALMRSLTGREDLVMSLGRVRGRFEANEQTLPLRIGWGALERLTVGATVPLVRRRVDAHLLLSPEGANVGENPAVGPDSPEVTAFRVQAQAALETLREQVAQLCEQEGQDSQACQEGLSAEAQLSGFLDLLDTAWDEAALFPMAGSGAGAALLARWSEVRAELQAWGGTPPSTVPLATRALSGDAFRTGLVAPIWRPTGFPLETPRAFLELGDVELHVAVGLARGEQPAVGALRVRSTVEGSLRFATGAPDSLALAIPLDPPRGYGGGSVRWLGDVLVGERIGVLGELAWTTYLERGLVLLGVDRADPWNPAAVRVAVRGAPGDRVRVALTPRFIVARGLSLGTGWEWSRAGEGSWSAVSPDDPDPPALPGWSLHRAAVELRFVGREEPVVGRLPFPLELRARSSWAFTGTEGAAVDRRLEMGARVLWPR